MENAKLALKINFDFFEKLGFIFKGIIPSDASLSLKQFLKEMQTRSQSNKSDSSHTSSFLRRKELLCISLAENLSILTHYRQKLSQNPNSQNEKEINRLGQLIVQLREEQLEAYSELKQSTAVLTYKEVGMPGDGHCFYHAVGIYVGQDQKQLRGLVANEIESNLKKYEHFLELKQQQTTKQYIESVRNRSEWASNAEITALMHILKRPIIVVRPGENPQFRVENPTEAEKLYADKGAPILVKYNGTNHYDALILVVRDDDSHSIHASSHSSSSSSSLSASGNSPLLKDGSQEAQNNSSTPQMRKRKCNSHPTSNRHKKNKSDEQKQSFHNICRFIPPPSSSTSGVMASNNGSSSSNTTTTALTGKPFVL